LGNKGELIGIRGYKQLGGKRSNSIFKKRREKKEENRKAGIDSTIDR
jgi:hypothetical protein